MTDREAPYRRGRAPEEPIHRRVPIALRAYIWFGRGRALAGMALAVVALAIVVALIPMSEPYYRSYDRMTPGEVEHVEQTARWMVLGDPIMKVVARYDDGDGTRTVTSYGWDSPKIGATVAVLQDSSGASEPCLAGMRPRPMSVAFLLGLLPLAGFGFLLAFSKSLDAYRLMRLVRSGRIRQSIPPASPPWMERGSSVPVEFETTGGDREKCFVPGTELKPLGAGPHRVIYEPSAPWQARLIALLPGSPTIADDKTVSITPRTWLSLILPLASVALVTGTLIRMSLHGW